METADPPSPLVPAATQAQAVDFSTLFDFLPIGAYRSSPDGRQIRANPAQVQLNGYTHEAELIAAMQDIARQWYVEPSRRTVFRDLLERQGYVRGFVSEVYRHKTGERIWVNENAHVVRDAAGHILFYEGTVEDITERVRAEAELRRRDEIWKLALESTGDGVWDWNLAEGVARMSRRCLEMYGFGAHDLRPTPHAMDQRTHPDDKARMLHDRRAHLEGHAPSYVNEHRVLCADGSWKWVLARGMVIERDPQGRPLRMIGTHTDITQRKNAEALVWQQANFDFLTGLPNRRMLQDRLAQEVRNSHRERRQLAVLFVDLDHFKEVNDTLGHDAGDQLLVEAARRMVGCVRDADTVARLGGDEFAIVVAHLGTPDQLERILTQVLRAMSTAFRIGEEQVFVSASIGITVCPGDAGDVDGLLKNADQALYVAKGAGRNRFSFYTPALQTAALHRVRLGNDLRAGLEEQQFHVEYQPIVDLRDGSIRKAEALLRWRHPVRGLVSPSEFIPVAESTGLIVELGEWVFQQVATQACAWRRLHHPDFQISVNKSPAQFHHDAARPSAWVEHLQALGLRVDAVTVEITEGLLLDTNAHVTEQLRVLRAAGMRVSLDDFGTGYSSLAYLQKLDIDYLKIDQSFVRNLAPDTTDLALCKAIIVMAHALGMQVVAEGVETTGQRALLVEAGCDFAQGFLYAQSMGPEAFDAFMAGR